MRTLAKPPKTKKIEKKEVSTKKTSSKKISKTTFVSPFHYKIQTLDHSDSDELRKLLDSYFQLQRQKMPAKPSSKRKEFISFTNDKEPLPTLVSKDLVFGCRQVLKKINKDREEFSIIVVFYEENRYERIEELLCYIVKHSLPFVIARSYETLSEKLAMKNVTCIGFRNEKVAHQISKLSGKCSIQIPWLIDTNWIPLKVQ